jgi:hypothetical protein
MDSLKRYEVFQRKVYEDSPYFLTYDQSIKFVSDIDSLCKLLQFDFQLYEHIDQTSNLKLAIDIDNLTYNNPNKNLKMVIEDICRFLSCTEDDISYSSNFSVSSGNYHIVIPKYFLTAKKQYILWNIFKKIYKYGKEIDTYIFCNNSKEGTNNRLPNQTKKCIFGTQHIIRKGNMKDFILHYIPETSTQFSNLNV